MVKEIPKNEEFAIFALPEKRNSSTFVTTARSSHWGRLYNARNLMPSTANRP